MTNLEIRPTRFGAPVARTLTTAALADLGERYGSSVGDDTPIAPMDFDPPSGGFVVAFVDGAPVGCGGWRTLGDDDTVAEIKRMYVAPEFRRRGVAKAVLRSIEEAARGAGKMRIVLETGDQQPEAINLYERSGYLLIPNFGYYRDHPNCRSFGRDL